VAGALLSAAWCSAADSSEQRRYPSALHHWQDLEAAAAGKQIALFSDYDGVLPVEESFSPPLTRRCSQAR